MRIPLTPELLRVLPVHDAQVVSIEIVPGGYGGLRFCLAIRLHGDESLDEISKLGITSRSLRLTCDNCWQISSTLLGTNSRAETIDDWMVIEESTLIAELKSLCLGRGVNLAHHRIIWSGGSQMDVVTAESGFAVESVAI